MRAQKIFDLYNLRAWFETISNNNIEQKTARHLNALIAHRASMRALPLAWPAINRESKSVGVEAIELLWHNLSVGVDSICQNNTTSSIAAKSASQARYLTDLDTARFALGPAQTRIRSAALARTGVETTVQIWNSPDAAMLNTAMAAIDAAVEAVSIHESESSGYSSALAAVRHDCIAWSNKDEIHTLPLWPDESPIARLWELSRDRLRSEGQRWSFWIEWYEKILKGEPQDWSGLLTDIALIPPEDWEKGPDHIASLIEDLRLKYAIKATPNAEIISLNPETGKFRADPVSEMPRDLLRESVEKLRNAVSLFQSPGSNQFQPIEPEVRIIKQGIEEYSTTPRMLYSSCARALRRLDTKFKNFECPTPDQDADIGDFHSTVETVTLELLTFDSEVKAYATHLAVARLPQLPPAESAILIEAADGVAEASEEILAEELPIDARAATDLTISDPDRKEALYVTASRFTRIWQLVQNLESKGKTIAGLITSAGTISAAVLAVMKPELLHAAIDILLKLFT